MTGLIQNGGSHAFAAGVKGYANASAQMHDAAASLNQSRSGSIDLNSAAVSLQSASLQAQASAEVIKRADGMLGTIIDIFV